MVGKIVTNAGINELPKLLAGTGSKMGWIAVGTSTVNPTVGDTAMKGEIARKAATYTISGGQVTFEVTFAPGELGSAVITEIGLLSAASGGVLYYRETRNPLSFDATVGATVRVKASFARGAA